MSSSSSPHRTLERTPKPGAPRHCRRALVTGATGFIGARLAAGLAEAGWTVRCLVRDGSRARDPSGAASRSTKAMPSAPTTTP
jgi:glycine/D-amino acid oxidase-like deaminating enzyme